MQRSQLSGAPVRRVIAAMTICALALAMSPGTTWAQVAPPPILTLQGKLTNSAGDAQNGATDFVIRLYDAPSAGTLLITDDHSTAGATNNPVTVTNGIYNIDVGGGDITAGSQATLSACFGNVSTVYMEIEVGTETLTPRSRVYSSGYALNADRLDGLDSTAFALSSGSVSSVTGGTGIDPDGASTGAVTLTLDASELTLTGMTAPTATSFSVTYGTAANTAVQGNQTATIAAGNGMTGGISADALGDGFSATLGLSYSATLAANPAMAAGESVHASTGLIFEGATADTFEGLLTVVDPTADRTWTLPDMSGTISVGGATGFGTPALTLGTANAAGSATTVIRSDATIMAFDATSPAALGTAGPGTATVAARRDHVHPSIDLGTGNGTTFGGILPVANGGTGMTSYTVGDMLFASAATTLSTLAAGTSGYVLTSNGAGVAPSWQAAGSGAPSGAAYVTMSLDGTLSAERALTAGSGIGLSDGGTNGNATLSLGALTANWNQTGAFDISLNNASSEIAILESVGGTFFGTMDVGDLAASRTYTFPDATGTVVTTGNLTAITSTGTIAGGTWNGTAIGTAYGGTGTSTAFTIGSVVFAGASGTYTQDNANLFWDDTNNRLGIGTTSPALALHVVGNAKIQSTTAATDSGILTIGNGSAAWQAKTYYYAGYDFGIVDPGGTTRLHISNTGKVGIGGMNVNRPLEVGAGTNGSGESQPLRIFHAGGTAGDNVAMEFAPVNLPTPAKITGIGPGSNHVLLSFTTVNAGTAAEAMRIDNAGNVGIGLTSMSYKLQLSADSAAKPSTNTWTIASDRRLKEDIRPFEDGIEVLMGIDPVWYRYNGKAGLPTDTENIGIVAQEIREVAPYTIRNYRAKMDPTDAEETDLLGFNSHALTFVLINAAKEHQRRIEALEAENAALRTALDAERTQVEGRLRRLEDRRDGLKSETDTCYRGPE